MDSAFIHQAANELVQNAGTRNIKQIARSCSLDISETSRMLQQFFFQFSIVLDDAVMYANDLRLHCAGTGTATVTGNMRMCIRLARLTVGCPTGMANTTSSFQCITVIGFLNQIGQTAFCFHDLCQCFSIPDSQSSRVIFTIYV